MFELYSRHIGNCYMNNVQCDLCTLMCSKLYCFEHCEQYFNGIGAWQGSNCYKGDTFYDPSDNLKDIACVGGSYGSIYGEYVMLESLMVC